MKIAMVCDWYAPRLGGIETQLVELAEALRVRGHVVDVITATPGPSLPSVHRLDVSLVPGWRVVASRRAIDAMQALMRRGRYDVIHAHSLYSPLAHAATWLAARAGVPSLLTSHSLVDRASALLLDACAPRWAEWPTRLTAPSSLAVADLMRHTRRNDITLLPNGIDLLRFAAPPRPPRDTIEILSLLRLHPRKRPLALVRALPEVLRLCRAHCLDRPVRLTIAGDGPLKAALQAEAARLGVAEKVRFVGAVPRAQVPALYAAADVFALPSLNEAFGLVALEARAAGLPVVAMRAGGAADLVEHGRDGLLAEDDAAFAAHLGRLVVDGELRARLAAAASRGLERYAFASVAARHEALYAALAGEAAVATRRAA
jgi:glycosyltransferase involved in cell wall biosynthesis